MRHKLAARLAGLALVPLAFSIGENMGRGVPAWLPGTLAVLIPVYSWRQMIVVVGGVVHRRHPVHWEPHPLRLDDLVSVSLRREDQARYYPLILRLRASDGVELEVHCWLWSRWRELAHLAGHSARRLGAYRDDVTARRIACSDRTCGLRDVEAESRPMCPDPGGG